MSGIDPTTLTPRVAPSGEPAPIGRPTSLGRGSPSGVSRRGAVIGPLLRSGRATPVAVTAARPPRRAMVVAEAAGDPSVVVAVVAAAIARYWQDRRPLYDFRR